MIAHSSMDSSSAGASGATRRMADFVANTAYDSLPHEVVEKTKLLILDTLACQLGGFQTDLGGIAVSLARSEGGAPCATVVGSGDMVSASNAAATNARLGCTLDADATFNAINCVAHHGTSCLASALALAEELGSSGRDLITAVAVGFDVGARIGAAMFPPRHAAQISRAVATRMGHGPIPFFASAASSSHLLKLGAAGISHAFGIASLYVPLPPTKWLETGEPPMLKSADAGWQTLGGLTAARLAERGATGFDSILEGEQGLWRMLDTDGCDWDLLSGRLGEKWFVLDATFKRWPTQRWMQYSMTAFERLRSEHRYQPEEIESVLVTANIRGAGRRFFEKQPRDAISCEFSYPHAIAMIALGIPPGPAWFVPSTVDDPRVKQLRARVDVVLPMEAEREDPSWFAEGQIRKFPGCVEVKARGQTRSLATDRAAGDPWYDDTRFGAADIIKKLRSFAGPLAPADHRWWRQLDRLAELVLSLEQVSDMRELRPLLHRS